jgi:hypothetical protein
MVGARAVVAAFLVERGDAAGRFAGWVVDSSDSLQ